MRLNPMVHFLAMAMSIKDRFGFGTHFDEGFKPPPPKKVSRNTAIKMSNQRKPGRK